MVVFEGWSLPRKSEKSGEIGETPSNSLCGEHRPIRLNRPYAPGHGYAPCLCPDLISAHSEASRGRFQLENLPEKLLNNRGKSGEIPVIPFVGSTGPIQLMRNVVLFEENSIPLLPECFESSGR